MKNNRLLLISLVVLSAVISFIYLAPVSYESTILYCISCFVAALITFFIFKLYKKKQVRKIKNQQLKEINDLLFMQCDPEPFIKIYKDHISHFDRSSNERHYLYCMLNLSSGLIAAGRYDDAREVLDKCKPSNNDRYAKLSDISRIHNLCYSCIKQGRTDEAENFLDELIKSMAELSEEDRQKYQDYLKSVQNGINVAKGIFDNAENSYNEAYDEAANNYGKASAKFGLGKVYLHFGDTTRAKEAFEYVVEYGNKLHIAEEAKEYLKQIAE